MHSIELIIELSSHERIVYCRINGSLLDGKHRFPSFCYFSLDFFPSLLLLLFGYRFYPIRLSPSIRPLIAGIIIIVVESIE